jgi:hypothetical protein
MEYFINFFFKSKIKCIPIEEKKSKEKKNNITSAELNPAYNVSDMLLSKTMTFGMSILTYVSDGHIFIQV